MDEEMPISTRLYSPIGFLKSQLLRLNLFNTGTRDENVIRNERRSTRLYLVLLIISLVTLTTYYSVISHTQTIVVQSPTLIQYSDLVQEKSLKCPCSSIAIKYEKFITIQPHYHEVCQSDFVSNEWIDHLFILYQQSWNKSIPSDFRRIGVFQFQTIRLLCQLAEDTIKDSLQSFQYTDFIQSQLISQELFQVQISSFIKNFIEVIPKTFLRTLHFVQDITAQSLFMVGASMTSVRPTTQYRINVDSGIVPYPGMEYTFTDDFTCVCSSSTATTCMGLVTFKNDTLPGFQTGCYMLSTLMNSTLEAFYNQTFVDILSNSSKSFQKLNSSDSKWKVEMLLGQMFVKVWSNSTSYEKYFDSCAPNSCQYTINQHYTFLATILLLIGLFGGLSSALKMITPILIMHIWPFIWKVIFRRRVHDIQIVTTEPSPVRSMNMRLKMVYQWMKQKLIELNLFKRIPPSQDETVLRQERHQTRIYMVLLLTGLLILTLFTSIRPNTITITVESPSLTDFTHLYKQYPLTLDCPCSQTAVEYNQFIFLLKAQYHQICLSEFITSHWIDLQFIKSPARVLFTNDIRYQSQLHFQLLSTLCRMANQTIEESLQLFYQTKLVTNQVLAPSSFQTQVDLILDQFKRTVPESYQRTLQLIQTNSEINQFIVPLNSDFHLENDVNGNPYLNLKSALNTLLYKPASPDGTAHLCILLSASECILNTMIIKRNSIVDIPGMFQTFFPLQSVLMSTLECFYNDTCLFLITQSINSIISPTNFSTLQLSLLSFNETPYDRIDILVNKLFIQSWNNQSSYQLYFNHCHPLICQYIYKSRFNIIYIATTFIGLLGGLDVALRLLVPFVVKLVPQIWNKVVRRKRNNIVSAVQGASIKPTFRDRIRILIASGKKQTVELNLFPTIPPSQDQKIIRRGRQTTRFYLILLLLSTFILAIYTSLTQETVTDIVKSPSLSTYSKLFNKYSLSLHCPCSHIAVKYEKFITQIEPEYYPICSSVFVSSNWSDLFYLLTDEGPYLKFVDDDFRIYAKTQFETVSKMCSLSQKILDSSLPIWLQTDFTTAYVISPDDFNIQVKGLIEEFKRKTVNQFMQTFKLIQITNHANQLATTQSSNWQFVGSLVHSLHSSYDILNILDSNIAQTALQVLTLPQTYGEDHCSCALQSNCSKLTSFPYRTSNRSLKQTLPGFRIGCLPLDALFQSTFSCLYNQTCLGLMRAAIYYSKPLPIDILIDSSSSSRNTTIETYLSQLFIIKWFENTSFDHYFTECAPESCQYSYILKFNRIYFVTTIIALFGGFTAGLHFAVSCVAIMVFKLYDRRKKNQVSPSSQQQNIAVLDLDNETLEIAPIPATTTIEIGTIPIREQNKSSTSYRERIIMICLCVLVIVAIIIVPVLWLRSDAPAHVSTITSTTTSTITSTTTMESTTTSTSMWYMTLVYEPDTYPVGLGGKSIAVADFNKDSMDDLAVTNYADHTISVLFGNGNGTFQVQQIYSTGDKTYPWGITTGDFNNDTFLDLAVTLSATNYIAIFFGIEPDGSFATPPHTFTGGSNYNNIFNAIEAIDINDDGFTDLFLGSQLRTFEPFSGLYVVLNLGDGCQYKYSSVSVLFVSNIDSIVIGDFDNDGRQNNIGLCSLFDKVTTLSGISYINDAIYISKISDSKMYARPQSLIRGRFNDDEFDDLAVVSSQSDTLQVLLAYGDGTFFQQIYLTDKYPTSIARINFNNDSIDDLAILTCNHGISIYLGTKLGIFRQNYTSFHIDENKSNQCVHSLRVADFNQDGKDDLVYIDPGTQSVRILLGTNCNERI